MDGLWAVHAYKEIKKARSSLWVRTWYIFLQQFGLFLRGAKRTTIPVQNIVSHIGVITHNGIRSDICQLPNGLRIIDRPVLNSNIVLMCIVDQLRCCQIEVEFIGDLKRLKAICAIRLFLI